MKDAPPPANWTVVVECSRDQRDALVEVLRARGLSPAVLPVAVTSLLTTDEEQSSRLVSSPSQDRPVPSPDELAAADGLGQRELVRKLNEAQRIAGIGSWDWDMVANAVWWSDETYRIFGVPMKTYVPTVESNASFVHPDDREAFHAVAFEAVRTGTPLDTDLRIITPDGQLKYCNFRGAVTRDAEGVAVRFSGTIADVTDRKRAEAALARANGRLALAQRSSGAGMWDWDITTGELNWSAELFQLFGVDPEGTATFDTWRAVLHPEDRQAAEDRIADAIKNRERLVSEYRVVLKDGAVRWIQALGDATYDHRGEPVRMAGICLDITGRKRGEEERARLEVKLQQAQKLESVGRLAGGVAHDFNNMLSVILANADLSISGGALSSPDRANLEEIRKAARRSADIVHQLLAFARQQTIAPQVLDLNRTIDGMLRMLGRLIGEGIELRWRPGDGVWPVEMDPSQVDQLLANLCVNARDAIDDVGAISVETDNCTFDDAYCRANDGFVPGDFVRLAVSDTGCGMDKEMLSQIFEPFFTTKAVGEGTGLGLATVYGIVKQNRGLIHVSSTPGAGTAFAIYLPRYAGGAARVRARVDAADAGRGHETILLVEDEPAILNVLATALERHGYAVLPAATPGAALRLATGFGGPIHLLMTDVVMPEMNGRDLAKAILSIRPDITRLFMSGYTADVIAHHGVISRGVSFIQKPFSIEELAAKVREVIDQT